MLVSVFRASDDAPLLAHSTLLPRSGHLLTCLIYLPTYFIDAYVTCFILRIPDYFNLEQRWTVRSRCPRSADFLELA